MKVILSIIIIITRHQLGLDQWRTRGVGVFKPPPENPKAPQNHAKLNPIVKTAKNC